jgi:hypothetical protein
MVISKSANIKWNKSANSNQELSPNRNTNYLQLQILANVSAKSPENLNIKRYTMNHHTILQQIVEIIRITAQYI